MVVMQSPPGAELQDAEEPAATEPGTGTDNPSSAGSGRTGGIDVQAMIGQLQAMIGKVAAASEPTLREVAAKAAELAAVAAERAGPLAHTIADKTDEVSHAVAGKASGLASSIRAGASRSEAPAAEAPVSHELASATDSAIAPAEDSPRDGA